MALKDKILRVLPIFAQDWLISHYGKKLIKQRYGKEYFRYREEVINNFSASREQLEANQLAQLKTFLAFTVANSPFYRDLYKNIDIDSINSIADMSRLPIVDKEMLRQNIDAVYTVAEKDAISAFTGGTTGKSLQVRYDRSDFQRRMAYLDAFKIRAGIDPFAARKATFSGREFTRGWATDNSHVFWRNNRAYNQRLYSTFDLTEQNLPYYVANLNEFRPTVINGFVSAIYDLACYIEREKITLNFKLDAIFTTSETLLAHHRQTIESVFNCHVYNQYASAEGAPFITECPQGELHYNIDTGIIEPYQQGEGDEVLITSFTTHGTPLIRYRIGDQIKFKDGSCSCGSNHPLVESIEGRQVDYLESLEYGKVSLSHLADVIKGLPNCIKKIQFHQTAPSQLQVLLAVDKGKFDHKAEQKIRQSLVYRFGESMQIDLVVVDDIRREASGKYALIKKGNVA